MMDQVANRSLENILVAEMRSDVQTHILMHPNEIGGITIVVKSAVTVRLADLMIHHKLYFS